MKVDLDGDMRQREIGQDALIAAMHATGLALAARTERTGRASIEVDGHPLWQKLSGAEP